MALSSRNKSFSYMAIVVVSMLVGIGAVYVTRSLFDNTGSSVNVSPSQNTSGKMLPGTPLTERHPAARGEMAKFVFHKTPKAVPDLAFSDGNNNALSITQWKGRVVLLNLWATWCAPCLREMPDLDRLQRLLGSKTFEVLALAVDQAGIKGASRFYKKTGLKHLRLYVDAKARAANRLRVRGMPTTLIIAPDGREIARFEGPAKWDGRDAIGLMRAVIAQYTKPSK